MGWLLGLLGTASPTNLKNEKEVICTPALRETSSRSQH